MKSWRAISLLLAAGPTIVTAHNAATPVLNEARFAQVALTVTDVDAARTFYRDRLGLRLMFEGNNMLFFDVGGTRLMIARDGARQRPARPGSIFYFHVENFAAALARLQGTRATLIGPVETVQTTSSGFLRLQQFEDADGNILAIMGLVPR